MFSYELFRLINMFVENLGLLSEIDIVSYLINQSQFFSIQMQMGGAYTIQIWMLYHAFCSLMSCKPFIVLFMFQNFLYHVSYL